MSTFSHPRAQIEQHADGLVGVVLGHAWIDGSGVQTGSGKPSRLSQATAGEARRMRARKRRVTSRECRN
jgi:hypothetical protein